MPKFVLIKHENFDSNIKDKNDKKGLERTFEKKFETLRELVGSLSNYRAYMERTVRVTAPNLPFTVRELPVFYSDPAGYYGQYPIGSVKVIED